MTFFFCSVFTIFLTCQVKEIDEQISTQQSHARLHSCLCIQLKYRCVRGQRHARGYPGAGLALNRPRAECVHWRATNPQAVRADAGRRSHLRAVLLHILNNTNIALAI